MLPPDNMIESLNLELINSTEQKEEVKQDKPVKRNTKQELINKIIKVSEDANLNLEYSDTKLLRMTKKELSELLAKQIEAGVKAQMAEQVGVEKDASERVIALGALRMVHNMLANVTENGLNNFLPKYGYEIDGFARTLNQEPCREAVDACLAEIAAESDIMEYIESPYARLALAWGGALISCARRHRPKNLAPYKSRNASFMGPQPSRKQDPVQPGPDRGAPAGQK